MKEFVNGADIIVRAAMQAGCNFFAGYPITPATQILVGMVNELSNRGCVALQAEDEIASIGMCIGAALTGARVMTATSGPGMSLYSENIGFAIMAEVPMVIINCQRMGPATGGATTVAQGDIQFMQWGTSGGYPLIVLSPTSARDCFMLTLKAFDLAEQFRVPVILATDKEVVLTKVSVEIDSYETIDVRERINSASRDRFSYCGPFSPSSVLPLLPIGGPELVRFTSSTHNDHGYLTKLPEEIKKLNMHLYSKIMGNLNEISMVESDIQEGADTLYLSYGISARSAVEAANIARGKGFLASWMTIYSLWPVPEKRIQEALSTVKRVVLPELNLGQYRREIERLAKTDLEIIGVNRIDGELISPAEILNACGWL